MLGSQVGEETIWSRLEAEAASSSSLRIVGAPSEQRSLGRIAEEAARVGASLRERGIGPGDRVAAIATTSFEFVLSVFGTWAAGATFVSLPAPPIAGSTDAWRRGVESRSRKAQVSVVLLAERDRGAVPGHRTWSVESLLDSRSTHVERLAPDDLALIQFSSGTTSDPRGVLLDHGALTAQFDAISARSLASERGPRHLLSWLPLYHDLGFIGYLLFPISRGDEATLIPTSLFLRDPLLWLREISATRATHSPAPNFAYGLVAKMLASGIHDLDLRSWRYASSGGEAIDATTLRRFARATERFGFSSDSFVPGYGLAEATCIVSVAPPDRGLVVDTIDRGDLAKKGTAVPTPTSHANAATFVSTGPPLEGAQVAILRDGRLVEERELGEILVKAPFVMRGYVGDPDATTSAFWAGWMRTGDLGYLADGEVYVTGRKKDLLVVRGQNLHPEDLERLLVGVRGMRPGCAVALTYREGSADEQVLVLAETKETSDEARLGCEQEIVRRIWRGTGMSPRVALVAPGSLPKTSSGKLQRRRAQELLRRGIIPGS